MSVDESDIIVVSGNTENVNFYVKLDPGKNIAVWNSNEGDDILIHGHEYVSLPFMWSVAFDDEKYIEPIYLELYAEKNGLRTKCLNRVEVIYN